MLRQILAITLKDLQILFRDRNGLITLFLMPIMFIFVMSTALSGAFNEINSDNPVSVLVVNDDLGELGKKAVAELAAVEGIKIEEYSAGKRIVRESAEALIRDGRYRLAIVFPADFSARIFAKAKDPNAASASVTFVADPAAGAQFLGPVQGSVQGFILRMAAYAQAPGQIGAAFDSMAAKADERMSPAIKKIGSDLLDQIARDGSLGSNADNPPVNFTQVAPANFLIKTFPDSVQQGVPGYTLFGVFFIVLSIASSMLQEKQDGTFRRLLVAPIPRTALLIGKVLPYYLVNLMQVAVMFIVGVLAFNLYLGHDPLALALVTLATASAATSLGLLVAAFGRTPEQIGGLSSMLVITLAALGGVMVPTFLMPDFMQRLSRISPHAWALDAYQDLIVRGLGLAEILPEVGALVAFAGLFLGLALWRFKFE